MGIIANYKYLSDKNLKELRAFYSEENDLDKMWDALHFVLTGVSSSKPIKTTLLAKRL